MGPAHELSPDDLTRTTGPSAGDEPSSSPIAPASIGRYRLLGVLGEGGMGIVYAAEQDHPRRKVALKVIRHAVATPALLKRFDHESLALGRLQHPGIAHILEAGVANGQPYFAMEFIEGETLLRHARDKKLSPNARIELVAKIADAVHHAHQRGIIHRDLKPGNILVDASGQPKVLDFGVAKITDEDAQATRQTDLGELVGTLAYMSPEQVAGDPLELDTRSDVYTLGLLLFELLTEKRPYTLGANVYDAMRTIREVEAPRLSSLQPEFRGDLDTIVAKALEKEKTRRYDSAAQLAGDLRRYLSDEPITARPATATYHIRKFARRHKALVAGVAAVGVALAGGIIVSVRQAQRADRAAANAQAIADFLRQDILAQASTNNQKAPDPNITLRAALDNAAAGLQGKFKDPELEASLRSTIGRTYLDLGLFPDAEKQFRQAARLSAPDTPGSFSARNGLAGALRNQSRLPDAKAAVEEVLARNPPAGAKAEALVTLATVELDMSRPAAAAEAAQRALAAVPDDEGTRAAALALRGRAFDDQARYGEAEPLLREALAIQRRRRGEQHNDTLTLGNNLAVNLYRQAKHEQALPLFEQVYAGRRRLLGDAHRATITSRSNLAALYRFLGRHADSEKLLTEALRQATATLGASHKDTLSFAHNLSHALTDQGKFDEAERLLTQTAALRQNTLGPLHQQTLLSLHDLAGAHIRLGRFDEAERELNHVLAAQRQKLGDQHVETLGTQAQQGMLLLARGRAADAERQFLQVAALFRQHHPKLPVVYWVLEQAGRARRRQGNLDGAAALLEESLAGKRQRLPATSPELFDGLEEMAALRLEQKRFSEAESLAREALKGEEQRRAAWWQRYWAQRLLARSLTGQGKREGAALDDAALRELTARRTAIPVERQPEVLAR